MICKYIIKVKCMNWRETCHYYSMTFKYSKKVSHNNNNKTDKYLHCYYDNQLLHREFQNVQ